MTECKPEQPALVLNQLAYSLPNFAKAVDVSLQHIRNQIAEGYLVPSYTGAKPLITREEGERWLRSLPPERQSA